MTCVRAISKDKRSKGRIKKLPLTAFESENIFGLSGPLHLTVIDWKNDHHRRTIADSLVKGAYILEDDRQQNRQGCPYALAPPWWEFFHFELIHVLVDTDDLSFFGCIFEFKGSYNYCSNYLSSHQIPPKYVIAFRGTVIKPNNRSQDLRLDLQCMGNSLHHSSHFQHGLRAVVDIVAKTGAGNVWLTGHSLGSAIPLLIGKNMAKFGCHLQTYLFNPSFISLPLEGIKNKKLKHALHTAKVHLTAGLAASINHHRQWPEEHDEFVVLSAWIPCLLIHPNPICSRYIGYFEHSEKMEIGDGTIGTLAATKCVASGISAARGNDSDAFHLLPSAYLTSNVSHSMDILQAHGINQWWKPDLQLEYKLHKYR